mmetsp:Transcript_5494/g.11350  ORF Transcript_5494/g.11350 Transcript_5494/m.11350 type:complete len:647 (-) Transcript_5494:418-2358(-)
MTEHHQQPQNKKYKSVGVIGLGPAGLATVKELKNAGCFGVVTGFDRSSHVGGRWASSAVTSQTKTTSTSTSTSTSQKTFDGGIWKELHANISRRHMEFSDFPWDAAEDNIDGYDGYGYCCDDRQQQQTQAYAGIYPHCTEVLAYLEAYAKNFDLYPNLQLETAVKSIERVEKGWRIITEHANTNNDNDDDDNDATSSTTTKQHDFDAIVVCNSAQAKPYRPKELHSKLLDFTGTGGVIHSQTFRSAHDFNDQRVLVIGGQVSGSEIASLLAENSKSSDRTSATTSTTSSTSGGCQKVVHSVRKMPYHISKLTKGNDSDSTNTCTTTTTTTTTTTNTTIKNSNCADDILFVRAPVWMNRILPNSITLSGMKDFILQQWPNQLDGSSNNNNCNSNKYECAHSISPDVRNCGISLTKDYVDQVKRGNLPVKPQIAGAKGNKVTFVDGTTEEFDVVICATGYDVNLEFLPESIRNKVLTTSNNNSTKSIMALYKHTLVPDPELVDKLAFCGLVHSLGPVFPLAEMQARYVAAIWSGTIPTPVLEKLESNATAAVNKKLGNNNSRSNAPTNVLNAYDMAGEINEDLGDELGVTPSLAMALWDPKKYLFGPLLPCQYRTIYSNANKNESIAARCQERFDRLLTSSPQHGTFS